MTPERIALTACVRATTTITPKITNAVVKAAYTSRPIGERQQQLDEAIRLTVDLLDKLTRQRALMRVRDRSGDAA